MRTTLNLSAQLVKAVRLKKLRAFMDLKGRVAIDEEAVQKIRGLHQ